MRIKKVAEAKHDATKTPTTAEFVTRALSGSLLNLYKAISGFSRPWNEPRGDLYHWIPLLNAFDKILFQFNSTYNLNNGPQTEEFSTKLLRDGVSDVELHIDLVGTSDDLLSQDLLGDEGLVHTILDFSRLLLDNCANRTLYSSSEHIGSLLNSTSSLIVEAALHLASRLAAIYYRSNYHRASSRQQFNNGLLQVHYRISVENVQKLAEPFTAHSQRVIDSSGQPQTPASKSKDLANGSSRSQGKREPNVHPNDLNTFARGITDLGGDFNEYGTVYFDLGISSSQTDRQSDGLSHFSDTAPSVSASPTHNRRPSGLSRLSHTNDPDDALENVENIVDRDQVPSSRNHRLLVISPKEIETNSLTDLMKNYVPVVPSKELRYAFLARVRFAKDMLKSSSSRQRCVAIRILAFTNIAFLFSETNFTQKLLQTDSQLPRELQITHQLAELIKPGEQKFESELRAIAMEALEAISIKHRNKHPDVCVALGINVNHGVIFQLIREVDRDLRSDSSLDAEMLDRHERVFNILDSLLVSMPITARNGRSPTMDTLISAGLFSILVEILDIRSEKAQHAQHRAIHFIQEASRLARDGVTMFANVAGLDKLADLITWEADACLEAVNSGNGLSSMVKSKVMDYSVPIWHQQTLRTALKFVNHLLSQQNAHTERLLRNLIDNPKLLKSIKLLIVHSKIFGSNIYANTISMVGNFLHNEPTSYSIIHEAGISREFLEGISSPEGECDSLISSKRKLPIRKTTDADRVLCGIGYDAESINISCYGEENLASNILCSTEVLLKLPEAFGALCLTAQGLKLFLSTRALESYFELFESASHVKSIASEKDLATYIGNAFDELVRHHPDLKHAVLRCFILTLARLAKRCQNVIPAPCSEISLDKLRSETFSGVHPIGVDLETTDVEAAVNLQDAMTINQDHVDAAMFITVFCRFINGFFNTQQMATSFLEEGGLPFILDLCDISKLPSGFVSDPGYDSSYDITKTIHMLAEARPAQTIPLVLSHAQRSINVALEMIESKKCRQNFQSIINSKAFDLDLARDYAQKLVRCILYVNVLQEMLSHQLFSHRERTWSPFSSANFTEMWVDIVTSLGKISQSCVRQSICLLDGTTEQIEQGTRTKSNGIGSEANRILGLSLHLPTINVIPSETDFTFISFKTLSTETNSSGVDQSPERSLRLPKTTLYNAKIVRCLLATVPNVVATFYSNVGSKIVSKRPKDYVRQNMFMLAEAVAKAVMGHLDFAMLHGSDQAGHVAAFQVVVLDMIRRILNISDVDVGAPSQFMTLIFLALRNNGVVRTMNELLERAVYVILKNTEEANTQIKAVDARTDLIGCSRSLVHIILIMYGCIVSSKCLAESGQSGILASSSSDMSHQFAFNSSQNLVETRMAVLPAVQTVWSTDGAERLASGDLRRIIRILRTILEADNESARFNKRKSDIPVRTKAKHRPLSLSSKHLRAMENESRNANDKWDHNLICEALYRCSNDIEPARDYADVRGRLGYPRYPPPSYDIDILSTRSLSTPLERNFSLPERGNEQDMNVATQLVPDLATTVSPTPSTFPSGEALINTASVNSSSDNDDDGHMAMSIDNVLKITEREQSASRAASNTPRNSENEPITLTERPSPPVDIAVVTDRIAIEDLENLRNPLRSQLIMRVMDILGIYDNLTVDLAELLSTAALKASDLERALQTREEFGETLIQALVSFGMADDFRENKKNIAACANLLARLMQDRDFYKACEKSSLFTGSALDDLLGYVKVFPDSTPDDTHPWVGNVLLIFEKLLSEELQPRQISWNQPGGNEIIQKSIEPIANYVDPILQSNQRGQLFDSIIELLPHIGKDISLALSVVRILAILTRHSVIASKLADKHNLQRLFLMVKQMAGMNIELIHNTFMLILRHISEDEEVIRRTITNSVIESFVSYRNGDLGTYDTTQYVNTHFPSILRAPKVFLEVTNSILEITRYNPEQSSSFLTLRKDAVPKTHGAWESTSQAGDKIASENPEALTEGVKSSAEGDENPMSHIEKLRSDIKPPLFERSDGIIHFLLSQLLSYKNIEDKETESSKPKASNSYVPQNNDPSITHDTDGDNESSATRISGGQLFRTSEDPKHEKKDEYRAEDHPIHHYRCILLQCLTELLMSYDQAKVEFINFSRKADPKASTPSKPRSGVLNYLLYDLVPLDQLTRETNASALKKQCTSIWAMSVIVALCRRTPETYRDGRDLTAEAKDSELLFVRRFVIEHAIKAYRDIQNPSDVEPEVRYARMLSMSDLFNRILMGRTHAVHSSAASPSGETEPRNDMHKTQVARIMYEKNLLNVLTTSCSEIDLNVLNAKRAVKYILRPLKSLTFTAIEHSKSTDASKAPGEMTDDEISTATSVSDISDDREETPDLFRHSALGMLDAGRSDQDESDDSEEEDEEMYDDGYDEVMGYEDDMDQVDDDEAVSDPDVEDEEMGPIEGRNGDMVMDIEVINSDSDDSDDEDDEDVSEDGSDVSEDMGHEDDEMEGMDDDVEVYDEYDGDDGESLDDPQHEWRDEDGEAEEAEDDDVERDLIAESARADANALIDEVFNNPGLSGQGADFARLNEDIESGRYMADLELVRGHDDEVDNEDVLDEDEEDEDDDDDADDDDAFMYENYDDEDDDEAAGWDMDEAFELIPGRARHQHHHHHHHHHHVHDHGHLSGMGRGPFGNRDSLFMTTDGRNFIPTHGRSHRGVVSGGRGHDEGINPLLTRQAGNQSEWDDMWRQQPGARAHHRGFPSWMHAVLGTAPDRGGILSGLMNNMSELISRHGFAAGGNIMIEGFPEDLELYMGGLRNMRLDFNAGPAYPRNTGNNVRDENSQVPQFTPVTTVVRWQEEAKMLFPGQCDVVSANVVNGILKLLVPEAIERQQEADRKKQLELEREREDMAQEEAKRKEEEENQRKEQEEKERLRREQEEQDRQERDAREREERELLDRDRPVQAVHVSDEPQSTPQPHDFEPQEPMEVDQREGIAAQAGQSDNSQQPPEERPRVTTRLRDRDVDITDLGIDADYIEALPEELREEVIMQALQDQRTQTADGGQPPGDLDPEFLEALPVELREEIIQQEESDRRRRERQETRRRQQEESGVTAAQPEEMDAASFLASLPPTLRAQVLAEENIDEHILNTLTGDIRREAEQANAQYRRVAARDLAGESRRRGFSGQPERSNDQWEENNDPQIQAAKKARPVMQMLDKQGIATILRLLFVPQQGSLKESLNTVFENLVQNRQNRAELISLLISILQEGSSDPSAVERSYANLSIRSRHKDGSQMTSKQLKRNLTSRNLPSVATMSPEVTPTMALSQCLSALFHLSRYNPHVQTFFVNEHETSSTLKKKGKGKEKEKDARAPKYALNALLGLLDKKMIMDNANCMEHLSSLLQHVTNPLTILIRKEREEREREEREKKEGKEKKPGEEKQSDVNEANELSDNVSKGEGDTAKAEQNVNDKDQPTSEQQKRQRNYVPPVVPESNLRLVINIITARECNGKIFRDTIGIINNMSAIPSAKDVFGKELVSQAKYLGESLAYDLVELLTQLDMEKDRSTIVSTDALAKFSSTSSDQTKLLRVLTALDYLFDPKRNNLTQGNQTASQSDNEAKANILGSLYDSPTFIPVWNRLSECLKAIRGKENVTSIATILLPLIEALMVVCKNTNLRDTKATLSKSQQFSVTSPEPESSMDTLFFQFTEDHRKILNDLVRNNPRLMSGTFSLLVRNPKVLEFDNKRNYFTRKLHNRDDNRRSQPTLQLNIRRDMIFFDSYRALNYKKAEEIKYGKLNIKFNGEEGVDAGGVTREWFQAISRQMFDANYALFVPVASDRTTFHPNKDSHINDQHLFYFKFVGRIIGKAMYEGRPLDCHFSRAVYKRILGKSVSVKDMETLDLDYYKSLLWMLENDITDVLTETFSLQDEAFGKVEVVDLIPDGRNIPVTEENKHEFVQKVVEYRLTGSVKEQLEHFLSGFHDIVPANLVNIFNEQELELLISGLPEIDIDDWRANTDYHNYNQGSAQIQWFWRAVRSFDKEERAKLLQFVTGTSKVPLNGFKELEGMNGFSCFNIHRDYGDKDRLPSSHTCFNQLDLPEYDDYETLRSRLYTAMTAGGEYFGFA